MTKLTPLERGRQKKVRAERRAAIKRVHAFRTWLRTGKRSPDLDRIPTDAEMQLVERMKHK